MDYKNVENELAKKMKEVYLKGLLNGKNIFAKTLIEIISKKDNINTADEFSSLIDEIKKFCNIGEITGGE